MNEKKKVFIILGVFALIIVLISIALVNSTLQKKKALDSFNETFASEKEQFIYIGRPGCSACTAFSPTLEKVIDQYHLTYLDINTDNLTESQMHTIVDKLELDWDNFGTPTIAIVKDNKVVKTNVGVISEEDLITFLKEGNMISTEE